MTLKEKIEILSSSAKYDVSCSSSGSTRKNTNGIGNSSISGICHSFTSDGRCVSLLKILLTNICEYDCKYCINRKTNNIKRAILTPEEIADITINFYKRNYIEGLFLSSGIVKSVSFTMELIYQTVLLLRKKYKFNGYIHVKTVPGTDQILLEKIGKLVDRVSTNIELPSSNSLKLLASNKKSNEIYNNINFYKNNSIVSGGQSTQMIIGATKDTDYDILSITDSLYKNYKLKRVYYSAYIPVNLDEPLLPSSNENFLKRENRLYQADFLLRFYKFKVEDILLKNENININLDPKSNYAINNLNIYPFEVNKASYDNLLKVPGIGPKSAKKILFYRKKQSLDFDHLKKLNVVLKRAKYFITCNGKYYQGLYNLSKETIKERLLYLDTTYEQLVLFDKDRIV